MADVAVALGMSDAPAEQPVGGEGSDGVFECEACGTCRSARRVPYDRLGYPVCPVCGHLHGPVAVQAGGR